MVLSRPFKEDRNDVGTIILNNLLIHSFLSIVVRQCHPRFREIVDRTTKVSLIRDEVFRSQFSHVSERHCYSIRPWFHSTPLDTALLLQNLGQN